MKHVAAISAAVVMLALAVSAGAQTFSNLSVEGLPTVYVTDRAGDETQGKLVSLTDSAAVVQLKDATTRRFTPDQVTLIERKGDSLKNGAIIGAVVGGVMGIATGGLGDCSNASDRSNCPGQHVAMAFAATGFWTAIGTAIDAAIQGRMRIWPGKPQSASGLILSVSPQGRRAFVGWRMKRGSP